MGKSKYLDLKAPVYRIACPDLFIPTVASQIGIFTCLSGLYGTMNTKLQSGTDSSCKLAEAGMFMSHACGFTRALFCFTPVPLHKASARYPKL